MATIWHQLGSGTLDAAEFWIAAANDPGPPAPSRARAWTDPVVDPPGMVLRAMIEVDPAGAVAAVSESVRALGRRGNPWYLMACHLRAQALLQMGDIETAEAVLLETERLSRRAPAVHAICQARLAMVAAEAAEWARSSDLARAAVDEVMTHDLDGFRPCAEVHAVGALAAARRRRPTQAGALRARALRSIGSEGYVMARARAHSLLLLADADLVREDDEGADALARVAGDLLVDDESAAGLRHHLERVRKEVGNANRHHGLGPSSISPAEQRVLGMLPTNLSMAEIADSLYVSRNTVKSQAIAVYRKLGVSARSPAVDRARELGLIE